MRCDAAPNPIPVLLCCTLAYGLNLVHSIYKYLVCLADIHVAFSTVTINFMLDKNWMVNALSFLKPNISAIVIGNAPHFHSASNYIIFLIFRTLPRKLPAKSEGTFITNNRESAII